MDEIELAWACGFFDGEGTGGLWKYRTRIGNPGIRPMLSLSNTDFESVRRFQAAVGVKGHLNTLKPRQKHHLAQLRWAVTSRQALKASKMLVRYCTIKQPMLQGIIKYYNDIGLAL